MSKFIKVCILGITYETIADAASRLNISTNKIVSRLDSKDDEWSEWCYVDNVKVELETSNNPAVNSSYMFIHIPTDCFYVGSTKDPLGRKAAHLWRLRNNKHYCKKLQELWNKDPDLNNWKWSHSLFMTRDEAYDDEQTILDQNIESDKLLNTVVNARSSISEIIKRPEYLAGLKERKAKEYKNYTPEQMAALFLKMKQGPIKRWGDKTNRLAWSGSGNPFAKKVMIDDVVYGSMKTAERHLNINEKTIRARVWDLRFPTYTFDIPPDYIETKRVIT